MFVQTGYKDATTNLYVEPCPSAKPRLVACWLSFTDPRRTSNVPTSFTARLVAKWRPVLCTSLDLSAKAGNCRGGRRQDTGGAGFDIGNHEIHAVLAARHVRGRNGVAVEYYDLV